MGAEGFETLEIERAGPLLRVWLARPARLNAIDTTMLREVGDLFRSLETDFGTRVVVLGGRGRSFCAGADRRGGSTPTRAAPVGRMDRVDPVDAADAAEPGDRELRFNAQLGRRALRAIEECEIPTVARVHGYAIGGGACFALACDFRVAARDAVLRVPEVDLGIPLSWGAAPRLIHEIGAARAREVLMLCEEIDAERAAAWGLVHRVADAGALDAAVDELADQLAGKPEMAIHMTKTQLRAYARTASLGDVTESDGDLLAGAMRSRSARGRFAMSRPKAEDD